MDLTTQALSALDRDRLDASLATLIRIPSVVGTEAEVEVAEYLADQWELDGLEVTRHDLPLTTIRSHEDYPGEEVVRTRAMSVTATYGNDDGPHILLLGHTDVVPIGDIDAWSADPFSGDITIVDGKRIIFGRGTCDMKAGMAAVWEAVRAVLAVDGIKKGRLTIASVCGEEDGGLGTFGLIQAGVRADVCIIAEPTSLAIVPANAGALTFRLTVLGKAIHASRKSEGVSAFEKFLPIHEALQKLELERNADPDALFERWNFPFALSIGTIHAGDWSSSVPGKLVAEGRIGVRPDETVEQAKQTLERVIADMCAVDPWLAAHPILVEWPGGMFAPGNTDILSAPVQMLQRAHNDQNGSDPQIYGAPYGSDLRLWNRAGVPTVQYGPGDVTYAHTADEFVDLDETFAAAQTFVRLIVNELG